MKISQGKFTNEGMMCFMMQAPLVLTSFSKEQRAILQENQLFHGQAHTKYTV